MPTYQLISRGALQSAEAFQYGATVTGSGSIADASTAALDANTAMFAATDFDDVFHTGTVWNDILVNLIPDNGAGPVIDSAIVSFSDAGADSNGTLPTQCAICISLQTSLAGSRNRGRFYLPPPGVQSLTTAGRLDSGALTGLSNGLTAWKNSLIGDGFTLVVLSRSEGAQTVVTNLRIGNVIDTQRRRRNGLSEVYTSVAV